MTTSILTIDFAFENHLSNLPRDQYFQCEHEGRLIQRKNASGNIVYQNQCLICGKTYGHHISKHNLPIPPDFDQQLFDRKQRIIQEHEAERARLWKEKYQPERTELYHEYLQSDEWKWVRSKVLERDNNLCQACLVNKATRVHHLTYKNIFREPCFDLVSVCEDCHSAIHQKDEQ